MSLYLELTNATLQLNDKLSRTAMLQRTTVKLHNLTILYSNVRFETLHITVNLFGHRPGNVNDVNVSVSSV